MLRIIVIKSDMIMSNSEPDNNQNGETNGSVPDLETVNASNMTDWEFQEALNSK